MLQILDAGMLATIQDLGRPGFGSYGVAPSGALDPWALQTANLLAGNSVAAAAIEFTLTGPTIAFDQDTVVALTGATFDASVLISVTGSAFERDVDARPAPFAESFVVRAGETLRVGKTLGGARGYLAVRGGIATEPVLGSASTQVSAELGGRTLRQGDALTSGDGSDAPLRRADVDTISGEPTLRAVPGPQRSAFTARGVERFFSEPYRVSTRLDRTGVRLEGPSVELAGPADLDPEGVMTGSVQVPADEQPIVLCNDRPATGGYVKLATVIAADLHLIAYVKPGDTLRFARTTPQEGRAAWRAREEALHASIEDLP